MSADNGIYILQNKDGFRVIHAQAIDNIYWWFKNENMHDDEYQNKIKKMYGGYIPRQYVDGESKAEINPKELKRYFGKSKVFPIVEDALHEAKKICDEIMSSEWPILEYGICFIPGWEDKDFPSE